MALLLSLETSSHTFSCALYQDEQLVSFKEERTKQSAAAQLSFTINQLFDETSLNINQVNAVVVSSGPGSYTGLRIGTSTAKGICYALNSQLIAVNTLELLLYQFFKSNRQLLPANYFLCPMLDARRNEVYCMLIDQEQATIEAIQAKIIDENSFSYYLKYPVFFFGEGSIKCKEIIRHPHAIFVENITPSAIELGELGYKKINQRKIESVEEFEPFYLKDFLVKKPKTFS
ncbi:MAG: tRNA (adenosine(37)-N6)-threonylcarbamoyltransferase complex dimerization subunit type 1 TsaB [Bacteroidetes bacterium]|nr:tRNA (adenosine(37)-N6)-threonylcarbamoyltransferase complex dimerization subunit type 1 TsaB [Bacteroidota bacterium]